VADYPFGSSSIRFCSVSIAIPASDIGTESVVEALMDAEDACVGAWAHIYRVEYRGPDPNGGYVARVRRIARVSTRLPSPDDPLRFPTLAPPLDA
jgi:hypothetical protein